MTSPSSRRTRSATWSACRCRTPPTSASANTLNIQPVYPLSLGKFNLINRAIIPITYLAEQEITAPAGVQVENQLVSFEAESVGGLGNITYQGFLSPAVPGKFVWGMGPVLQFPTNTDDRLGTDKWSAGIAAVGLTMPGNWVIGVLAYNIWDFAGPSDAGDVNSLTVQYFVNYNLEKGWYLTSTPVITANWEADSDQRWTVPFGLGIGRLVTFGKQPVDFKIQPFWYAEKPDGGPEWSLQLQAKFLFPK